MAKIGDFGMARDIYRYNASTAHRLMLDSRNVQEKVQSRPGASFIGMFFDAHEHEIIADSDLTVTLQFVHNGKQ